MILEEYTNETLPRKGKLQPGNFYFARAFEVAVACSYRKAASTMSTKNDSIEEAFEILDDLALHVSNLREVLGEWGSYIERTKGLGESKPSETSTMVHIFDSVLSHGEQCAASISKVTTDLHGVVDKHKEAISVAGRIVAALETMQQKLRAVDAQEISQCLSFFAFATKSIALQMEEHCQAFRGVAQEIDALQEKLVANVKYLDEVFVVTLRELKSAMEAFEHTATAEEPALQHANLLANVLHEMIGHCTKARKLAQGGIEANTQRKNPVLPDSHDGASPVETAASNANELIRLMDLVFSGSESGTDIVQKAIPAIYDLKAKGSSVLESMWAISASRLGMLTETFERSCSGFRDLAIVVERSRSLVARAGNHGRVLQAMTQETEKLGERLIAAVNDMRPLLYELEKEMRSGSTIKLLERSAMSIDYTVEEVNNAERAMINMRNLCSEVRNSIAHMQPPTNQMVSRARELTQRMSNELRLLVDWCASMREDRESDISSPT